MSMQFNKPRFDWEAKDHLSELEQFKQECPVLFNGPLSEMKDQQKVGLIINWIGCQCTMILSSIGTTLDKHSTVFKTLESIFRPESAQTLSRFKLHGLKQKQSQTCNSYMSGLGLAIVECRYPNDVQDELLKDQYIFGLCVNEVQDHLLGEIVPEETTEECLLESRKIESKIEQRKLLGIKTTMTYDTIYNGRNKSRNKSHGRNCSSSSGNKTCKYCGKSHNRGNCPVYRKKCQKCGRDNHFKSVCRSDNDKCEHESSHSRPKKGHKGKQFHEINEEKNKTMDNLTDQVQSLFYHNIHFNTINM